MSNVGQGFATELERQAKRILGGEVIIGGELDMLNNALEQWMEKVSRLQAQAKARNKPNTKLTKKEQTSMNK